MKEKIIIALIAIGAIILGIKSAIDVEYKRQHAPCSEFSDRFTSNTPVRCLKYFSK